MAIKKIEESSDDEKMTLEISNGHLEALNKIVKDYNIINAEKALGFIIAVASQGNGKAIRVGEDTFVPGEAIKKQPISVKTDLEDKTE